MINNLSTSKKCFPSNVKNFPYECGLFTHVVCYNIVQVCCYFQLTITKWLEFRRGP